MKSVFDEFEIYRVGGDEFVVFCTNITEEELSENTDKLRSLYCETDDVRFAVGSGLFSGQYDISEAMNIVDERMYEDKKAYYARHPEKNRRK